MVAMLTESASVLKFFLYPINIKEMYIPEMHLYKDLQHVSCADYKQLKNLCKDKNAKQKKGTRCSI